MKAILLIATFLIASVSWGSTIGTTPTKKTIKNKTTKTEDSVSVKSAAPLKSSASTHVAPVTHSSPVKLSFLPPSSHSFQYELVTSVTSGGIFSTKPCKGCQSATSIGAEIGFFTYLPKYLENKLQVGGEVGLASQSAYGQSSTDISAVAVGIYNMENDFKNSLFIKAGLGLYTVGAAGNTETKLGLFVGGGKRFAWLNNVTFTPEARIVKQGDLDFGIEANVLNFSIYWN